MKKKEIEDWKKKNKTYPTAIFYEKKKKKKKERKKILDYL
jgi:hypothetical protein